MPFKKIRKSDDAPESLNGDESVAAEKKRGQGVSIVKRPDGPAKQGPDEN